jgi:hypothetical protein
MVLIVDSPAELHPRHQNWRNRTNIASPHKQNINFDLASPEIDVAQTRLKNQNLS